MPSPILARADALMQRRRQNAEIDDVPVLTDAIDINAPETEDDVPVLFDIEPIAPLSTNADAFLPIEAPLPELPEILIEEPPLPELNELVAADPPAPDASLAAVVITEDVAREIARRVEQRLTAELPRIIEATVRDFLAEQATADRQQADSLD